MCATGKFRKMAPPGTRKLGYRAWEVEREGFLISYGYGDYRYRKGKNTADAVPTGLIRKPLVNQLVEDVHGFRAFFKPPSDVYGWGHTYKVDGTCAVGAVVSDGALAIHSKGYRAENMYVVGPVFVFGALNIDEGPYAKGRRCGKGFRHTMARLRKRYPGVVFVNARRAFDEGASWNELLKLTK